MKGTYPNETIKLLHQRGSCRHFQDKPIPQEIINQILGAAVHAPSAGNLQAFSIIIIKDTERKNKLMRICGNQNFIVEAPINIVVCVDERRSKRWANLDVAPYTHTSNLLWFLLDFQLTGIIGQTICIAADAFGIGSCYVGNATAMAGRISELLELPEGVFPGTLISLGYPSEPVPIMKKLEIDSLVHEETYKDLSDDMLLAVCHEKYSAVEAPRVEITENRLKRLYQTCLRVHGNGFAERSVAHARKLGFISPIQRYFGLHYRADWALDPVTCNSDYRDVLEKQGFRICRDYEPTIEK